MSYQALARKYRPETFAEVVGQEHVTGTLRAALRRDKLSHAYLFSGPRGCGKTTVARLLAKALNCSAVADGDPCGACDNCRAIARGNLLDVLEIDAASHTGVDNVRELRDMAQYTPGKGGNRVFIIDEVHMLSKGAFNALLKILEEPPARVFFFFATTEPNKIPRTILSRCQRFDFRLLGRDELAQRLRDIAAAEKVDLDEGGLSVLVSLAEGSMRDGLSLFDQAIASCEGTIDEERLVGLFGLIRSELYLDLNDAFLAQDAGRALQLVDQVAAAGQDLAVFALGVVMDVRNLLLVKVDPDLARAVDLPPEQIGRLTEQAARFREADLLAMLERAGLHYERIHRSTQPRILLEAMVVELARWESRVLLADLVARLRGAASGSGEPAGGGRARPAGTRTAARAPSRGATSSGGAGTVARWSDFVEGLMRSHPRIAACLMEGLPSLDTATGVLTVAFAEDKGFVVQSLQGDLPVIQEKLGAFHGQQLRVEFVTGGQDAGPSADEHEDLRRRVAPTQKETLAAECRQDPQLGRLVEALNAEPVPETERERYRPQTTGPEDPQEE